MAGYDPLEPFQHVPTCSNLGLIGLVGLVGLVGQWFLEDQEVAQEDPGSDRFVH